MSRQTKPHLTTVAREAKAQQARESRPFVAVDSGPASLLIAEAVQSIDCYLNSFFQDRLTDEFTAEEEDELDYEAKYQRRGMKRLGDLQFNEDRGHPGPSILGLSKEDLAEALNMALECLWETRGWLEEAGYPMLLDADARWTGTGWRWLIDIPGSKEARERNDR